jgi:hypothetical protein
MYGVHHLLPKSLLFAAHINSEVDPPGNDVDLQHTTHKTWRARLVRLACCLKSAPVPPHPTMLNAPGTRQVPATPHLRWSHPIAHNFAFAPGGGGRGVMEPVRGGGLWSLEGVGVMEPVRGGVLTCTVLPSRLSWAVINLLQCTYQQMDFNMHSQAAAPTVSETIP